MTTILIAVGAVVVGFVVGVLVGRANKNTVNTVVGEVKSKF